MDTRERADTMADKSVTILGAGNTGFAAAARLTLRGFRVTLYEIPGFEAALEPIRESRTIQLTGAAETGSAKISKITSNIEEAPADSELVLVIVPAYAHKPFAMVWT